MSRPSARAAARTVLPGATETGAPSIVREKELMGSLPAAFGVPNFVPVSSLNLDGLLRARLPARITPGAQVQVDHVPAVGRHGNRFHRATLGADRAAGAVVQNAVLDKRGAFARGTAPFQVSFVLFAKIFQRG